MKPEVARHIIENGGLLAKDSVLVLLDYIESADRKIEQLISDRQQAVTEIAEAQRDRDNWRVSFNNERYRADKLLAELQRQVPNPIVYLKSTFMVVGNKDPIAQSFANGYLLRATEDNAALDAAGVKYEVR